MNGIIKVKKPNGFGFITPDGGEKDIFFNASSCVGVTFDELQEGDKVSFDTAENEKGTNAVNLKRV